MEARAKKGGEFLSDVKELRRRARQHIEDGAVTPGYTADRDTVIKILNEALATEIVCVLRYKRHYFRASTPRRSPTSSSSTPRKSRDTRTGSPSASPRSAARRTSVRRASPHAATRSTWRGTHSST
jgi:hypothetical protein